MKDEQKAQIDEIFEARPEPTTGENAELQGDLVKNGDELPEKTSTCEPGTGNPDAILLSEPGTMPVKGQTDFKGNPFDPDIHRIDPDTGLPKINKTGKNKGFLSVKNSNVFRKPKTEESGSFVHIPREPKADAISLGSMPGEPVIPTLSAQGDSEESGKFFAQVQFVFFKMVFGPEWEPTVSEEKKIQKAYTEYFEKTGKCQDINPAWNLVLVNFNYTADRLRLPETKSRLERWAAKITDTFNYLKWRLFKIGTYSYNRPNRNRENDNSKTDVSKDPAS